MVVPLGPGKFYGSSLPRPRIYTDVKLNDERVDPPVSVLDPLMLWAQEAHWSMGGLSFKRLSLQGRIEGSIKKLRAESEKLLKKRNQGSATASATATSQIGNSAGVSADNKNSSPSPPPAPMATKRRRFMALIDDEDDDEEVDQELKRAGKVENGGDDEVGVRKKRRPARKLGDDFDRVATESGLGKSRGSPMKNPPDGSGMVASRTRSRRTENESDDGADLVKVVEDVNNSNSKGKKLKRSGEKKKAKNVAEIGYSTPAGGTRTSPRLVSVAEIGSSTPAGGTKTSPRLVKRGLH